MVAETDRHTRWGWNVQQTKMKKLTTSPGGEGAGHIPTQAGPNPTTSRQQWERRPLQHAVPPPIIGLHTHVNGDLWLKMLHVTSFLLTGKNFEVPRGAAGFRRVTGPAGKGLALENHLAYDFTTNYCYLQIWSVMNLNLLRKHSKQRQRFLRLTKMRMPCLLVQSKQERGTGDWNYTRPTRTWLRPPAPSCLLTECRVPGDFIPVLEPWDWQVLQGFRHHRRRSVLWTFWLLALSLLSSDLEGHTIQF